MNTFYAYTKDSELYHYGRMGMKWGKHIYGKSKSSTSSNKKHKLIEFDMSEDANKSSKQMREQAAKTRKSANTARVVSSIMTGINVSKGLPEIRQYIADNNVSNVAGIIGLVGGVALSSAIDYAIYGGVAAKVLDKVADAEEKDAAKKESKGK